MVLGVVAALTLIAGMRWSWLVLAMAAAAVAGGPLLGVVPFAGTVAARAWRSARSRRSAEAAASRAEVLAADAVGIGVAGGLTFEQAVARAADAVHDPIGDELRRGLRRTSIPLPAGASSPVVARLFEAAASSRSTGGSLAAAVGGIAFGAREDRDAVTRERLARVPVRLLFPLALFILPGFVLMTVGPAVVSGLSRVGL
jgi:Flp pilus assembly protein TadB